MNVIGQMQVKIEDDQTDRIGIRTLVLSQGWQAAGDVFTIDALDAQAPATPDAPRGMELIGRQRRRWGGGLREFWTYTGVRFNGKDVEIKTYGKSPDYHFEPSWEQLSLLEHRNIERLLNSHSGAVLDGQIVWPPTLGGGQERRTIGLGDAGTSDAGGTNPMFGHQTFFNFSGAYCYRYVSENLNRLTQDVRVVGARSLPGHAPSYGNRNYLIGPEEFQRHAGFYAITLRALLSPIGGWNKPIYQGRIG